jgi:hypothetical protein
VGRRSSSPVEGRLRGTHPSGQLAGGMPTAYERFLIGLKIANVEESRSLVLVR